MIGRQEGPPLRSRERMTCPEKRAAKISYNPDVEELRGLFCGIHNFTVVLRHGTQLDPISRMVVRTAPQCYQHQATVSLVTARHVENQYRSLSGLGSEQSRAPRPPLCNCDERIVYKRYENRPARGRYTTICSNHSFPMYGTDQYLHPLFHPLSLNISRPLGLP